jgi:hypothetical protein
VVFTIKGDMSAKKLNAGLIAFIVYFSVSFDPVFKNFAIEILYLKLLIDWNKYNNFCFRHSETALKPSKFFAFTKNLVTFLGSK